MELIVTSAPDSAPTNPLVSALTAAGHVVHRRPDSDLIAVLDIAARTTAVLRITPHFDDYPVNAEWYEASWAYPGLCDHDSSHHRDPYCPVGADWVHPDDVTEPDTHLGWIPVPGKPLARFTRHLIPFEERLAAAPEPDISQWSPGQLKMLGGEDGAVEAMRIRQWAAIRDDRTVDAYDWPRLVGDIVDAVDDLTPPTLTWMQRVSTAGARLAAVRSLEAAARHSLRDRIRNADNARTTEPKSSTGIPSHWARYGGVTRATVDTWRGRTMQPENS